MRLKSNPRDDIPKRTRSAPERVKPLTLGDLAKQAVTELDPNLTAEWAAMAAANP
jgi:hypothetical protein